MHLPEIGFWRMVRKRAGWLASCLQAKCLRLRRWATLSKRLPRLSCSRCLCH